MEWYEVLAETLKYSVPALLVLLAVRWTQESQAKREQARYISQTRNEVLRQHFPLRLNAYERAILFLERISPENLLPRLNAVNVPAPVLHRELILEIKQEFEHNLSQQLYISPAVWAQLVHAKEELINLINLSFREMEENADGMALAKDILAKWQALPENNIRKAILMLKSDVQPYFSVRG
ncbi:MAG: hypothetical protein AAFR61_23400 [Bacteroidota bacterium]